MCIEFRNEDYKATYVSMLKFRSRIRLSFLTQFKMLYCVGGNIIR